MMGGPASKDFIQGLLIGLLLGVLFTFGMLSVTVR
jgi:hypothetical protein